MFVAPGHPELARLAHQVAPLSLDDVAPVVQVRRRPMRAAPRHLAVGAPDATVCPYGRPITSRTLRLRPYQQRAVQAWRAARGDGVIEAPCGSGKTEMGVACIAATATPALVLVHSTDLVSQWVERVRLRLAIDAVVVDGPPKKRSSTPRVAIATFQRLARWTSDEREDLGRRFGLVVVDEAHHVPARTWGQVLADLPGRYRLALTATPDRLDGLRTLLHLHCGPTRAAVPIQELQAAGATMAPEVRCLRTGWRGRAGRVAEGRVTSAKRNRHIIATAQAEASEDRSVLVLTTRVTHAEALARAITRAGVPAATLVGPDHPTERAARLAALRAGVLRVLCATQLADEALDLPELDTVILTAATEAEGRTRQRIGRALRPHAGKGRPRVYDLVDADATSLEQWRQRSAMYRDLGWGVVDA